MNESLQTIWLWLQNNWWIAALVLGLVLLVAITVRFIFGRGSQAKEPAKPEDHPEDAFRDGIFGGLTPALAGVIPESRQESKDFSQLLRRAGLYSPGTRSSIYAIRFVVMALALILALTAALLAPAEQSYIVLIVGLLIAAALSVTPRLYVYFRQRHRVREIRNGLADMMDMLSMCFSGGLPVLASLDHVARNLTSFPTLASELQIMKRQAEVGSLSRALNDFASRVDIPEARQLANLLGHGDQLGTQLSQPLQEQADHFRATRKQVATLKANRTPVILTIPLFFCFAPAALILFMTPTVYTWLDYLDSRTGSGESQLVRQIEELEQDVNLQVGGSGVAGSTDDLRFRGLSEDR